MSKIYGHDAGHYFVKSGAYYYPSMNIGMAITMADDLDNGDDGYVGATLSDYGIKEADLKDVDPRELTP